VICDFHPVYEERRDRVATHPVGGRGVKNFVFSSPSSAKRILAVAFQYMEFSLIER
jgi:hypothetical protein